MSILESLTCGLPVVSLDCPVGPRAIIKDRVNGLLVSFGSTEEETIQNLADAFSLVADGRVLFDEAHIKDSVKPYQKPLVKLQWEEFLSALKKQAYESR